VALPEGSLVVNSSQGGGSKDTWVLASRSSLADRELGAAEVVRKLPDAPKSAGAEKWKNGKFARGSAESDGSQEQQSQSPPARPNVRQGQQQQQGVMR
jgi:hypothetical protein